MQVSFRHKTDRTTTFIEYGSKRYQALISNPMWECMANLTDDDKKKLDADIERRREARAGNSIGELFKTGGARLAVKLQAGFQTIDDIIDSTPQQISEVSGLPIGKAQGVYNSAVAYMNVGI